MCFVCLWLSLCTAPSCGMYVSPKKFIVVSAPLDGALSYTRVPARGFNPESPEKVERLVWSDLTHPMGIAINQNSKILYVADAGAKSIFSYPLEISGDYLSVGTQEVVLQAVDARWVAVDSQGNLYFTEEARSEIAKIPSEQMSTASFEKTPVVLFSGLEQMVSAPGGIATDNNFVYWVNKVNGTGVGSVIRGRTDGDPDSLELVAQSVNKSYGICLGLNNVYFSQPSAELSVVKKSGGPVKLASKELSSPRGCAYDGDGTIYLGDRQTNGVYSFAGNMAELSEAVLTRATEVHDAFGVAMVQSGAHRLPGLVGVISILFAVLSIRE